VTAPALLRVLRTSAFVDWYRRGQVSIAVALGDDSVREYRFTFDDVEQLRGFAARLDLLADDLARATVQRSAGA
jgi:hypothetical protein